MNCIVCKLLLHGIIDSHILDIDICIIEDNEENVEDLINAGHPIVIGDATETANLELANAKHAKEVYININDKIIINNNFLFLNLKF